MNLIQRATSAIFELADLASGNPDPVSVIHVQAKLIQLHMELGQEMCQRFSAKERAYLSRKLAAAREYQKGRLPGENRLTAADATEAALLAVGAEWEREIASATEYEGMRTLLRSLQNSLDFARSLVSFYKSSESNS